MKRIIDISDEDYREAINDYEEYKKHNDLVINSVSYAIANSIPLTERTSEQSDKRTCTTCRNHGSHHGICDICHDYSCWTAKEDKNVPETNAGKIKAEDCISRNAVCEILKIHWLSNTISHKILDGIAQDIHELPSVYPKSDNEFFNFDAPIVKQSYNSVLEDIRAQIDELEVENITCKYETFKLGDCTVICKDEVLEIIDKHISGKK